MTDPETAAARFAEGWACSQAVFSTYAARLGLSPELALRIAAPFGAGMARAGQTCGAVTGALMVIGLKLGHVTAEDKAAKEETYQCAQEFMARFKAWHGSLDCRELLGCDLSAPEGLQMARAQRLFDTRCPVFVRDATELVGELLGLTTPLSFKEIAQRLDHAGIAWAVFAGTAACVYGSPRSPTDIDILIPAAEGGRASALFPEAQVKRCEDGSVWILRLHGCDILAGMNIMDMDAPMLARLARHEIAGVTAPGVTAPVIPPEDNILFKGWLGRGPEEGKHDWEDVQAMLAHLPALDWEYLRWRASLCHPQEHARSVLERLEMMWRQIGQAG